MTAVSIPASSPPTLRVSVESRCRDQREFQFSNSFRIGRTLDCEVCVQDDVVSRNHAEVTYENGIWWIRDLDSSNGIYIGDERFHRISVRDEITITLGVHGPQVTLEVLRDRIPDKHVAGTDTIVARYVDRYFGKATSEQRFGEHTLFVRKAFAAVQKRQRGRYAVTIAILIMCMAGAIGYAFHEHQELKKQRDLAEALFYDMKSLDVDIASLEKSAWDSNSDQGKVVVRKYEGRRKQMEKRYDQFLTTLQVYKPKMTEQQRLILRVARIFGECELNMPPDFTSEVNRYINYWRSSGRFVRDIKTAKEKGYTAAISHELLDKGLPPQFFYLALQESDFDPYISGPITRNGIAKGMWQFMPETAVRYGLKIGPLADQRRPDPGDDRDRWDKETKAAAGYLNDLYSTDAQASGLLVMACYNWGEVQVLPLVRNMPANPKERNFWQLLSKHRDQIPRETYDYVFYIFSAAVIGENPRLFGFDLDNPLLHIQAE
jgi:membrane-bound lytic murein transglycosylase D